MDQFAVLLVDKPPGLSSFAVLKKLKHKFGFKKLGHAGTLDPDATGLLVVLLGSATRLQRFILEGDKSYSGRIKLGVRTNTDDLTGEIVETKEIPDLNSENLDGAVLEFKKRTEQIPPIFSAISTDGVRAYKRARAGEEVTLQPRAVSLSSLELELVDADTISYRLTCTKGFYVRSFARDVAAYLGTVGTAESIRRESTIGISVKQAKPLAKILELPIEELPLLDPLQLLPDFERLLCSEDEYQELFQGKTAPLEELSKRAESPSEVILELDGGKFAGMLGPVIGGEKRQIEFLRHIEINPKLK